MFTVLVFVKVLVLCSCGLAALAMAGQLLTGTPLDANHLLQDAVNYDFSFHGEMFSGALPSLFRWLV